MTYDFSGDYPLRSWEVWTSVTFRKTGEEWGGFSNMCAGFPIIVNGTRWANSEALYQAMRFPDFPDVQEMIRKEKSPMAAKMKSKPFRKEKSRADWEEVRIDAMWWSLVAKYSSNPIKFGNLLRESKSSDIVEHSHRDRFWGAVSVSDDYLYGQNVLGLLLTRLRRTVITETDEVLRSSIPPKHSKILGVDYFAITESKFDYKPDENPRLFD